MKKLIFYSIGLIGLYSIQACNAKDKANEKNSARTNVQSAGADKQLKGESVAYFAEGCFWCSEEVFESLVGVREVISGYSGGKEKNPSYSMVSSGNTSHAEAIKIYYDSTKINYPSLVKAFFASHDATTLNQQGPDVGKQYRSIAFYQNSIEQMIIQKEIQSQEQRIRKKIVTQVIEFKTFYSAESYHQNYIQLNPDDPYVQSVSLPRFLKFKAEFKEGKYKKH